MVNDSMGVRQFGLFMDLPRSMFRNQLSEILGLVVGISGLVHVDFLLGPTSIMFSSRFVFRG